MLPNAQCKLPLAQLWTIPAFCHILFLQPWEKERMAWPTLEPLGYKCLGVHGRFFTGHVQWKLEPFDAWEGTNVQTTIKCSSGSRPKINKGIFTKFSTGLLARAVFQIITPFWKTVHNRKAYFFWNSSNSAEIVWTNGTKTKSYLSFMKSWIQLTLHNSLWESVKMAMYVQKWLSTHHPTGSCTGVQQPVNSQVPFSISKKWSNIHFIGLEGK